jgi:anti-sigma B factor antagonist
VAAERRGNGQGPPVAARLFRLHVEHRTDGRFVLVAVGEADIQAAPQLDRSIRKCEDDGEVSLVVVDLTGATLLDSTALGVLVAAHGRLAKRGIPLKLVCTNRLIKRVLTITGLDRVFDIYTSSLAALDGQVSSGGQGKEGTAFDGAPSAPGAASES